MDFSNIGKALKLLRVQRMKKQREIAEIAGITPAMLSAYETGKHRPSLDTAERVLGALECDILDLTRALKAIDVQEREQQEKDSESSGDRLEESMEKGLVESDLKPEERELLASLIPGFLKLIRYLKMA